MAPLRVDPELTGESCCFRTDSAHEKGKYGPIRITWRPEQLDDTAARYVAEEGGRRGATPRSAGAT